MNRFLGILILLSLFLISCVPINYFQLGHYANREKRFDDAIRYYTLYLKDHPDDADAYSNRGLAYFYKGKYEKAIADFEKAIVIKPELVYAYNMCGLVHAYRKEYQLAMKYFDKAIEYEPGLDEVYRNRGWTHACMGKYELAIKDYSQAISIRPIYYHERGMVYYYKGDYDRAINDYTIDITNSRGNASIYHNRAVAYYSIDDYARAIDDCNNGLGILAEGPDDYIKCGLKALRFFCIEDYEKAIKQYTKAIKTKPDLAGYYCRRGDVYYKLGEEELAIADWRQANSLHPAYPTFSYARKIIGLEE